MSKIKQYVLCLDGTEHLINAKKTVNEDGQPAIKIWFYYNNNEESAELGFKNKKKRKKYWEEINIETILFFIKFFDVGVVTLPQGGNNE